MRQLYYAIQTLIRGRDSNITKILSLTVGLFIGILLFACIAFQLSFNNFFREPQQLYVTYLTNILNGVPDEGFPDTYGTLSAALRENFPQEVEDATTIRDVAPLVYYHDGKRLVEECIYGDDHSFSTLGIRVLAGRPEELLKEDAVFISRSMAQRIGVGENLSDAIGQTLYYNRTQPFNVRGVFEDIPENTDIRFDVVNSMSWYWNANRAGWGFDMSYYSIVRFRHPDADAVTVEARLPDMLRKYMPDFNKDAADRWELSFRPLSDYHTQDPTVHTMIVVMFVLAVAILLLAAFNYVLISISSMARRAKAVGVHKCSGATGGNVFSMFLLETAMIVLFSILLVGLLMYNFRDFVEETVAARLSSLFSLQTLWVPALVVLLVFLLAGVLPAWLLSSVPVTQVFRRYTERKTSWKRPLLFIQFVGVTFILGFLVVVVAQYHRVTSRSLGYDPSGVAVCWAPIDSDYDNTSHTFRNLPMIADYSAAAQTICEGYSGDTFEAESGRKVNVRLDWVAPDFVPMMGIRILQGHNFSGTGINGSRYTDHNEALVNEEFVRQAGLTGDVVGSIISWHDYKMTIIGVMADFAVRSAYDPQPPVVLVQRMNMAMTHYVRLKPPFAENLKLLNERTLEMFPAKDIVFSSLEQELEDQYVEVRRFRNIAILATISIFLVTLMGLLGYVNDEIRRRSKEIAIRKVNGATARDIIRLLSRDIAWTAIPAVLLGCGFAYFFGLRWLESFADQARPGMLLFAGVALLVLLVIAVCVVFRTWRIANENPVKSIKSE